MISVLWSMKIHEITAVALIDPSAHFDTVDHEILCEEQDNIKYVLRVIMRRSNSYSIYHKGIHYLLSYINDEIDNSSIVIGGLTHDHSFKTSFKAKYRQAKLKSITQPEELHITKLRVIYFMRS